jgi:hypothetical protein
MCHYTGAEDDSHLTAVEWKDGKFTSVVMKITSLSLDHLRETKKPYSSKYPPPPVSS